MSLSISSISNQCVACVLVSLLLLSLNNLTKVTQRKKVYFIVQGPIHHADEVEGAGAWSSGSHPVFTHEAEMNACLCSLPCHHSYSPGSQVGANSVCVCLPTPINFLYSFYFNIICLFVYLYGKRGSVHMNMGSKRRRRRTEDSVWCYGAGSRGCCVLSVAVNNRDQNSSSMQEQCML